MAVRFSSGTDEYTAATGLPSANVWTVTWWSQLVVDRDTFSCQLSVGVGGAYVDVSTQADGVTVGVYDPSAYSGTALGNTVFTVGTWYRLGLSVNGTTANFYRADAATGTLSVATAAGDFTATNPPAGLSIGDSVNAGNFPWSGRIAALKMWDAALTQAEVEVELAQYLPHRITGLLRFHPFVKTEAVDYSGNANTLSGGAGSTTEDGPPIPWIVQEPLTVLPTVGTDYTKTVTDPVGLLDSATRVAADVRAATDPVGLLDSRVVTRTSARANTDPVGILDSASDVWTLSRTVTNPEGITDTASDTWQLARTVTDTVGLVDAASGSLGSLSRLVTDAVGIVDSVVASSVGPQSGARIRISGREPNNHLSGREPNNMISGTEVATP